MRRIYIYNNNTKGRVDKFINNSNIKIKKKFQFILEYIANEKNQFKEPYVKHFSVEKYKKLYEIRLKITGTMVRIIFVSDEDNIVLLHAFIKRDKRDTEQALEHALRIMDSINSNEYEPQYYTEVELN